MQTISYNCKDIKNIIDSCCSKKPFFVCSKSILNSFIFNYINDIGIDYTIFNSFNSNPIYEDVVEGLKLFKNEKCDLLIAIGGGSAIDVAKAIKYFFGMNENVNYLLQEYVHNDIKILAIPTTAGTGSESTRYAVIYYNGIKQSISNYDIIPNYVILESELLRTLPLYQKKATILDSLCQAIESYWSVNSNYESRKYAKESIKLILDNMKQYLKNNESLDEIMKASNLSGKAINITQTTAPHAMSYKITSLYGISHGHAVALCLPYVYQYMVENIDKCVDKRGSKYLMQRFEELSEIFDCSKNELFDKFISIYDELSLDTPKVEKIEDLDILTDSVNTIRLKNNPVYLDDEAIKKIYFKALKRSI